MTPATSPADVVLVVDDAPANLALLLDCLGQAGLELRFAESVEQALARLDHARPDLILLDVLVPPPARTASRPAGASARGRTAGTCRSCL